jgi:hypothetical protein
MSASGLLRWLILLALLVAPLAMIGEGSARAHVRDVEAGHCADPVSDHEAPSAPVDCMVACAGCLPTQCGSVDALPALDSKAGLPLLACALSGLHPEAATPPPRTS